MPLTQLSRRFWHAYFDRVSAALAGRGAQVEPAGLGIEAAARGQWTGLDSLSYDAERDELALGLEGERHFLMLRSPLQVLGARV